MNSKVLVTGATGKVGRALVNKLEEVGVSVRAGLHSQWKTCGFENPDTELVPFDFEDTETIRAAVQGVHTVVLLTPADSRQVDWAIRTIDHAKQAGVKRIVRMSVLAAAMEPGIQLGRWHRTVERYLVGSGLDWTIVRPGPFMQNFLGLYPSTEDGFRLPLGSTAINHIHTEDVAAALAAVVIGRGHSKHIYMLTGADPLPFAKATQILAEATGKPLDYRQVSLEDARSDFLAAGRPAWLVDVLIELFSAFDTGAVALQTSTFKDLTGQTPTSFAAFAAGLAEAA
jgi:uncharacterized protein YbjT (DUF2867 family)